MARAKEFIAALGEKLRGMPDLKEVIWKIENPALERSFLLFLTPEQIDALEALTARGPLAVRRIAGWTGFRQLFGAMADRLAEPVSPTDEEELATGFTFIDGLLGDMTAALEGKAEYDSRLQQLFFGDGETFDPDGFYRNGDLLFLLIMPAKDFSTMEVIAEPLARIRAAIADVQQGFPDVPAGLTGRPVLAADEIATSDRDMTRATILALLLVGIIFILFFRSISRPLLAMASLVMGIAWTFGFVALLYGELNILSIVFALILVGAAIEYAIHLVARYQEELAAGRPLEEALAQALATAGRADLTSALTTAAAFLTITWTDFTAIAQLGVIAASGILLCLAAMLVVLPAMLVLRDRRQAPQQLQTVRPFTLPTLARVYRRPGILFVAACVVTVGLVPFAARTGFDNNLLNLQARGLESVHWEHVILERSNETTWFARAVADSIPESHALAKKLAALPSVRRVDDIERILPEKQEAKIARVRELAPAFEGVTFVAPAEHVDAGRLLFELGRIAASVGRLQEQAFSGGRLDAVEELEGFLARIHALVAALEGTGEKALARLGQFQGAFLDDLHRNLTILASGMDPAPVELDALPDDVVGRFVSPKGRYALFIYPKENIWDPAALERFVTEIRGADPSVVGTPIEVYESGRLMRETFLTSALLAFAVICLLVLIDFRSWRAGLLAVMPLAVGLAWLLGAMGLFGIPFNMANFFAIPILIGIGVDFGVHLVHRIRRDGVRAAMASSTTKGVLLTAIANAVGFGAMLLAAHRGIASLGQIMAIGSLCCLAAAMVAMPPVAVWLLDRHRERKG